MRTTKPTTRTAATASNMTTRSRGVNEARRVSVARSPAVTNINTPTKANYCLIRNAGANIIRINFDSDPAPQYWELKPSDEPIEFEVNGNTVVNAKCMGSTGEVEIVFHG